MAPKQLRDLDSALEGVLKADRMRPAPMGLRRRVETRVRYIALQQQTRRHFRSTVLAGTGFATGLTGLAVFGLWYSGVPGRLADDAPGVLGHLDRVFSAFPSSTLTLLGIVAGTASGLLALISLAGLMPHVTWGRIRHRS